MKYFVVEKFCENACKLMLIGESFDSASEYARSLNCGKNNTVYIMTGAQIREIFFSGCSRECFNKYLKEHFKCKISDDTCYLYMPLPANFNECLSDLNALFLANIKDMGQISLIGDRIIQDTF